MLISGLSGNEIYCLAQKGWAPGEIVVANGDERLELHREGGDLRTVRARTSGGIVIKTEALDVDTWLSALAVAVARQAERSERTRQALQQIVLGR